MTTSAEISADGLYRYRLSRRWGSGPSMLFIMLNPSTADATADDPTIRRCIGFAERQRFNALEVVNLFAYRATDPAELDRARDPIGPDNDRAILLATHGAQTIVAAWGAHRLATLRAPAVLHLLADRDMFCLGLTKSGAPRHPLYVTRLAPLVTLGRRP